MSDEKPRDGWNKIAISVILTFLVSSGFWNILQQYTNSDKVTRAEVKTIVRESGPYSEDRAMILQRLDELKKNVDELRAEIRAERRSK